VTWFSTVGTGLISAVICSRMAFRQRGGEEAWTAADSERSRRRVVPTQRWLVALVGPWFQCGMTCGVRKNPGELNVGT
jgi:hypothetical protein